MRMKGPEAQLDLLARYSIRQVQSLSKYLAKKNSCIQCSNKFFLLNFTGTDVEPQHKYTKCKYFTKWGPRFDKIVKIFSKKPDDIEDDEIS